jgi:cytochrome c-type biogenesis protein CcmH/NrfG
MAGGRALIVLLSLTVLPVSALGQVSAVAEAVALRDRGEMREAASRLRAHLAQFPDDGDAARLLAQTLYWLRNVAGAREV